MATVGAVWINVLPSMQGFANNLQKQATSAAKVAAVGAGRDMGRHMGDATVGAMAQRMGANSKRMQNTFTSSTNVMTRGLANFQAGFRDVNAAASAFTGRMGAFGGVTRTALQPGITAVQGMGTGLTAAGTAATNAFGAMRTGAATAFSGVGSAVSSVGAAGAGAASQLTGAFTGAATSAADTIRNVLGGAIGQIGAMLGAVGLGMLGAQITEVATGAATTEAQLTSLYGAAGAGAEEVNVVMDGMAERFVGLDMTVMRQGATDLAYMGLQGEEALGVLERMEAATRAAGSGAQGMDRAFAALTKGVNAGKFQMVELNQISDAGIPIYDALADVLGVDIPTAQQMATDGAIGLEEVLQALSGDHGQWFPALIEGAENMDKTFSGAWDTIKNTVVNGFANELVPLFDRAAPMMMGAADAISAGFERLPGIVDRVREVFSGLMEATGLDRVGQHLTESTIPAIKNLWTAIQPLAAIIGGALVIGMRAFNEAAYALGPVLREITGWLAENRRIVTLVGAAILGGVAAYYALGAASAIIRTITSVTRIWAVAQAGLNAVMAMNPITLVVIAIGALVAAAIYAYHEFDAFRNVIDTVWQAVKTAALWIWDNGLKPAFEGIVAGAQWVGQAVMSLWNDYISPAFNFIWGLIKNVVTLIIVVAITPLVAAFRLVSTVAMWLWNNGIKPAFEAIGALATWLWNNAIKPAFDFIMGGIRTLATWVNWLWNNVFRPVFNFIGNLISAWWNNGVKVIFNAVINFIRNTLSPVFTWLRDNIIRPVWNAISSIIDSAWNNGIKPAFEKVMEGVDWLKDAFDAGKEAIADAWEGIKESARTPINFLIDTVFNDGIRPLWNRVAGIVGADELDKVATFAAGGRVFGAGTATSDSIPALLSNGEHVWTAREVQAAGGHGAVESIRARALDAGSAYRDGGQVAFPGAPRIPSASTLLQAVKDFLSPSGIFGVGGDIITGNYEGAVDRVLKPARTVTAEIGTEGLPGTPHMIVKKGGDLIKEKISELVERWNSMMSAGGGGADDWVGLGSASERLQAGARFARSQHGLPYQWGGNGNPSWDCSGFVSAIESVIRGQRPHRRWSTHAFQGSSAPAGWVRNLRSPYMIGVTHAGVGHTAGTLMGVNVESAGGGKGVVVGSRAQGYRNFPYQYGFARVVGDRRAGEGAGDEVSLYDRGGYIQPGLSLVSNQTGGPEPVLTQGQWRDMHRLAESVGAGEGGELMRDAHIHLHEAQATVREAFRSVDTELRKRRRGGVHAGRVGR